jgi:hypothetical protein
MHDSATQPSASDLFEFEVVRHRDRSRVLHRNRHSSPYPDQAAAILAAKDLARKKQEEGHAVEVRLVRTDGQVVPQSIEDDSTPTGPASG